jgi:hypothetical protein
MEEEKELPSSSMSKFEKDFGEIVDESIFYNKKNPRNETLKRKIEVLVGSY